MSKTLNLVDLLLNSGRHLRDIGRTQEALDILTRLADFRKLPSYAVEEIQALLADLYMQREDYGKARRHLTAALAFRPLKAEYHYMMAVAIEEDSRADLSRAEKFYAAAVEMETDNASYWLDYGTYLVRVGKSKDGLKAVRKAYALASDDPDIVGPVAEVLRREERLEEATTKLRAALFQNHGAEPFQRLWQHHQFELICAQQTRRENTMSGRKKGPVILPFLAAPKTGKYLELGGKTIRFDRAEAATGPKSPLPIPFRRPPKG